MAANGDRRYGYAPPNGSSWCGPGAVLTPMSLYREDIVQRELDVRVDLLDIHRARPDRYPFLLESVSYGPPQGRYDILFAFPESAAMLDASGRLTAEDAPQSDADFLRHLDSWWGSARIENAVPDEIPVHGGWFVYLGYELAGQIEPVLDLPVGNGAFPVAAAWRVPAAIIQDKKKRKTILVAERRRAEYLEALERDLRSSKHAPTTDRNLLSAPMMEEPADEFLRRVDRIKHYIREGDVFQVNLSRGWEGRLHPGVMPAMLYQRLRVRNPAPFAGLAVWEDFAIVSSSPERLVRVHEGVVETRPIAGTHPRHQDAEADRRLAEALIAHPKERAEHIMLIDLERNDLGRVCETGSVHVDELMTLESYTHVHHIVSNVRGRLRASATPGGVLRAVFPGGTITGCPKVRCMEIIAELEQAPRGPYTGAMGYLNRDGSGDFCILIRVIARHGSRVSVRAGSGIVADSVPVRELEETRHKARGPLRSLSD